MKTVINLKTDWDVKKNAQELAKKMGLSLSAIVNAYLRQFVRSRELYFSMTPTMTIDLEKLIGLVETDIKTDHNLSREISSPNELKKYLKSI